MADHDHKEGSNLPVERSCSKCKGIFPADAAHFYRDKQRKDGLHSWCRACCRQRGISYRYENYDKVIEAARVGRSKPGRAEKNAEYQRRQRELYPEKIAARQALNNAIKRKEIARQPCSACGVPNAHAHHHDYSKPLDVEWMCRKCHMKEHRYTPEGLAALESGR